MCPDKELISAYYDDELDGKWAAGIKSHIDGCDECEKQFRKIRNISVFLEEASVPGEDEIKERIFGAVNRRRAVHPEIFRIRSINISFPAFAGAAALAFVFLIGLLIGLNTFNRNTQVVEEIQPQPSEVKVQVISLEDAAAYILSDDSGFDVLITIPPSENLSVAGEPKLIRVADYERSED